MSLDKYIRNIADFPKPGIAFKDITPLLADPHAVNQCLEILLKGIGEGKIDKVVGIESRGFFFGTLLANRLGAGFVPIRKPGKLPFDTVSATYDLEYGSDTLQIHSDAILKGEKVLVHDDIFATGGTASAACQLVEKLGGEIVQCNFIMELRFLNGRGKIPNYDTFTAISY